VNPKTLSDWESWLDRDPAALEQTWHDPNCVESELSVHNTILHLAVLRYWNTEGLPSDSALVEVLLSRGARPNCQNDEGETALHLACSHDGRCKKNVQLLLEHGADPNIANESGKLPIHFVTSAYGVNPAFREIADLLIKYGSNVDFDSAVCMGNVERAASFLSDSGLEQSADPKHLLYNAVMSQSAPMVELILAHGADPNPTNWGQNPLYTASQWDNSLIVTLLLKYGADPNPTRYKPLAAAKNKRNETIIKILKSAGAR